MGFKFNGSWARVSVGGPRGFLRFECIRLSLFRLGVLGPNGFWSLGRSRFGFGFEKDFGF